MDPVCYKDKNVTASYYCAKYSRYLCENCLACQDPTIYCKFRKMCMIWEVIRFGTPEMQEKAVSNLLKDKPNLAADVKPAAEIKGADKAESAEIVFLPNNRGFKVESGKTILEAARDNEIYINARCGGKGVCGSCRVKILEGRADIKGTTHLTKEDIDMGYVLACTTKITGSITAEVPEENKARALKIVEEGFKIREKLLAGKTATPFVSVYHLELPAPTLDDPSSDLDRVNKVLKIHGVDCDANCISLPALAELSSDLRRYNWKVNITLLDRGYSREIIRTTPYDTERKHYGLAVDMGTTSVVAYLVDLTNAEVAGVASTQNRQVVFGEDVISRIISAKGAEGLERLHGYAMKTINGLINELVTVGKIHRRDILSFVVAGNTVMTQSVLKLDPSSIRTEPYVPVAVRFPIWQARDIGLDIHPHGGVFVVPGNAAYVGGDITAGIIASGLNTKENITLFIDVGTNGEMVLGTKNWMMTASCSAGPAFEGGGIRHGMRALPGAIDDVTIDPVSLEPSISVIDGFPPAGICGSGMISLIGSLYLAGILDSSGKFNENLMTDRVASDEYGKRYIIAREKDSGIEEDIFLAESDIAILIQSKAAIYSGFMTLLKSAGVTINEVNEFLIAGGFGRYINFKMAILMGLLPDIDLEKFKYLGNSSIAGAYLALVSADIRKELCEISKKMTYVDFSSSTLFYDEYRQAMFLPHTDVKSFPSVMEIVNDNKKLQKKRQV